MFSLFRHLLSKPRLSLRRHSSFRPSFEDLENRCLLSGNTFVQTNLVSSVPGLAEFTNPRLVNPWGIAATDTSPLWVSDNGTGFSTIYHGDGMSARGAVTIPAPDPAQTAAPTGIVVNTNANEFMVQSNDTSGSSIFIFATEDGTISGWSPGVDNNNAILTVDNSASGAVYKGLALASNSQGDFLYATNFHNGTVDVFDSNFQPAQLDGSFTDPRLPAGYAPFGISNINGLLYVTYAKQNAEKHDDIAGIGHGFVDVFDTDGHLMSRLISRGLLDSPWGLAVAPSTFGKFANDLLVGNFGNGNINAYDLTTGAFKGTLRDANHQPIVIDGLWGLTFGNGQDSDANALYFTAGINHEMDGLFGTITVTSHGGGADPGIGIVLGSTPAQSGVVAPVQAQGQLRTDVHPGMAGASLDLRTGVAVSGNLNSGTVHAHAAMSPAAVDGLFALDLSSRF
jgi:uncharacterized protein (TIGR03118 family)